MSDRNTVWIASILLLLCSFTVALEQPTPENAKKTIVTDFDVREFPKTFADNNLYHYHISGNYSSTGRPYSGYVAIFPPQRFSFYPPVEKGCVFLAKPSESSTRTYNCEYATNGAFFTKNITATGSLCIGNLVSDGKAWQLPTDGSGSKRANFGITPNSEFITGFVNDSMVATTPFTQLITGWGWLVRHGINYVNSSQDLSYSEGGFTLEKAPRTAVGHFANGTMLLLEVDGEEDINYGPDLFEMGELLEGLGVESAVNIDGGGSSVSVLNGEIIDQPTCKDTPEICERAVASITCVRKLV
jgi:N-acetylglucosamine-1-phosphodiester alpha-N-acetylglucosaminidase